MKTCFVLLGNACNQDCSYCYQKKEPIISQFNESIIDVINKHDRLYLFGGEPFLYLKTIKEIISHIGNKVNFINITTNGTLLTKDIVDWVNDNNIHISLSHDGYNHSMTRGYEDILKKNPKLYLEIKKRGIIGVCTQYNYNYYNLWDYIDDFNLRYNTNESSTIQYFKNCNGLHNNYSLYHNKNWEAVLDYAINRLVKALRDGNTYTHEYKHFRRRLHAFLYDSGDSESRCSSNPDKYTHIDLSGNIYSCHNYKKNILHINATCHKCKFYSMCGGGCGLADENKYCCYIEKTIGSKLFEVIER